MPTPPPPPLRRPGVQVYFFFFEISIVLLSRQESSHIFTWAERQVKDSQHSGMSQSYFFGDTIGHTKSVCFRLESAIWRVDKVRAELFWDISRALWILWFILKFIRGRNNYFWLCPGFEPTHFKIKLSLYYMAVSQKDWKLTNLRIWLAKIDLDRGLDFPI